MSTYVSRDRKLLQERWYELGIYRIETISDIIWEGAKKRPKSFLAAENYDDLSPTFGPCSG